MLIICNARKQIKVQDIPKIQANSQLQNANVFHIPFIPINTYVFIILRLAQYNVLTYHVVDNEYVQFRVKMQFRL